MERGIVLLIQLVEGVAGPFGWKERWAHVILLNRVSSRLKALWREKDMFPPEEYWLLDARMDLVSFSLLCTTIGWGVATIFGSYWLAAIPVLNRLILAFLWTLLMGLIWLGIASSVSWLWWMAYLMGVEAVDLRVLIGITRKLTGRPEMEPIRFEAHNSSSESVPDECKDL